MKRMADWSAVSLAFFALTSLAHADTCVHTEYAELQSMSSDEIKTYYSHLGDVKWSWLNNAAIPSRISNPRQDECDVEADRVKRIAKQKGMQDRELFMAGKHTFFLGKDY